MINFIYTLLTLAAGILLGSAGVFLLRKNLNRFLKTLLWIAVICPATVAGIAFSIWCENQVHPHSLSSILSAIVAVAIYAYGIFLSITIHFRNEVKEALKDAKKIEWITAACTRLLQQLPTVLWVVLLLDMWDCYSTMATAIGISIIALIVLWFLFHFAWWLKYHTKNPRFL